MTFAAQEAPNDPHVIPSLRVDGVHFSIQEFAADARAYGNRQYVWKNIPARFAGWQFTRTDGGRPALIRFTPDSDGLAFLATGESFATIVGPSWQRLPDCGFHYTDGGNTRMAVYQRFCRSGETVTLPRGNWQGGILLAPRLERGQELEVLYPLPPGRIISQSPDPRRQYIGSPSIAVLPDGTYVASHDWFGPGTTFDTTSVFASTDRGRTWGKRSEIRGQFWSTLFVHRESLYILGTDARYGHTVIRRSKDGGRQWTTPDKPRTGLLLEDTGYHCAPVPVVAHNGRLWRAMEDNGGGGGWGRHFRAFVMSVPQDADPLDAGNWTASNRLAFDPGWDTAAKAGWLEGNVVVTPQGGLVNILRVESSRGEMAAACSLAPDGHTLAFDPTTGFLRLPGGRAKFTVRCDPESKRYWSLVNKQANPPAVRNVLALVSSADLAAWETESVLLMHPDAGNHAWQYVDWVFEGDDILAVSRTAWGDSHSFHDANYLTFHRVRAFRTDARTIE